MQTHNIILLPQQGYVDSQLNVVNYSSKTVRFIVEEYDPCHNPYGLAPAKQEGADVDCYRIAKDPGHNHSVGASPDDPCNDLGDWEAEEYANPAKKTDYLPKGFV